MIVLINGSFGVGKSTVASILRRRIAGSRVYNPEWPGSVLMRLPSFVQLRGSGTDDFQDIDLWRWSVVRGTSIFHSLSTGTTIVPMALKRRDYFDEIVSGFNAIDKNVKIYCLKAEMPTILKRLERRSASSEEKRWTRRKAEECVEAHEDPHFGEPIDTEDLSASEVADEILKRLRPTAMKHAY